MTFLGKFFNLMGFSSGKMLGDSTNQQWKNSKHAITTDAKFWKKKVSDLTVINRFTNRITSLGGGVENFRMKNRQIKRSFPCRQQIPQSPLWINRYAYELEACLIFTMFNNRPEILLITHWTYAVKHDIYAVTYFRIFLSNKQYGEYDNKICNVEN